MSKPFQGPPAWRRIGQHDMLPEAGHDDAARFNFLASLNKHLAGAVFPGVEAAYSRRVKPAFVQAQGRSPKNRHEVRRALLGDPYFQAWSALRRNAMELRQQAGRALVLRQIEPLAAKAAEINRRGDNLELDPDLAVPSYVRAADNHCMPGSYYTELIEGDVSPAANYDCGLFVTTGGAMGRYSDGGGQAVARYLEKQGFRPQRVLDLGCGVGHTIVPIAAAFPEAEVVAVDVAAPMLRYAAARAHLLGVDNLRFIQKNAESTGFPDQSFDLVMTAIFLHETSTKAIKRIMAECFRLLRPGGLTLHLEQPQYTEEMDLYEQAMRDWDCYYNEEPFWSRMHELDLRALMAEAGFDAGAYFETGVEAVVDAELFPPAAEAERDSEQEDYGRKPSWHAFGCWK